MAGLKVRSCNKVRNVVSCLFVELISSHRNFTTSRPYKPSSDMQIRVCEGRRQILVFKREFNNLQVT